MRNPTPLVKDHVDFRVKKTKQSKKQMKKYCIMAAALFTVSALQAQVVPLVNADFNTTDPVGTTAQIRGFDNGIDQGDSSSVDTPGWHNVGVSYSDSGTEMGGYNPTGTRNMYLMYGDDAAYQTSGYAIGTGFGTDEGFDVSFSVGDIWEWAYVSVSLYYDNPANVIGTQTIYADVGGTGWWSTMSDVTLNFSSTVASQGGLLGIMFQNIGGTGGGSTLDGFTGGNPSWAAIDDVSITVVPVPEPSTFALAGIGLAVLVCFRKRA